MTDQLAIRIPSSQKSLLETIASQNKTTISQLVRTAIDRFLEKAYPETEGQVLLELADIGQQATQAQKNDSPKNLSSTYKDLLYPEPKK